MAEHGRADEGEPAMGPRTGLTDGGGVLSLSGIQVRFTVQARAASHHGLASRAIGRGRNEPRRHAIHDAHNGLTMAFRGRYQRNAKLARMQIECRLFLWKRNL